MRRNGTAFLKAHKVRNRWNQRQRVHPFDFFGIPKPLGDIQFQSLFIAWFWCYFSFLPCVTRSCVCFGFSQHHCHMALSAGLCWSINVWGHLILVAVTERLRFFSRALQRLACEEMFVQTWLALQLPLVSWLLRGYSCKRLRTGCWHLLTSKRKGHAASHNRFNLCSFL